MTIGFDEYRERIMYATLILNKCRYEQSKPNLTNQKRKFYAACA